MNENKPDRDPRKVAGVVLIAIGALLFILQYATGVAYSVMFLVVGSIFLAVYFGKRSYGYLIPGCIMLGIGIGQLGDELYLPVDDPNAVGLGIGFLSIYVIDKLFRGSAHWWPLIPALVLIINGVGRGDVDFGYLISRGWPLVLVIVGVLFLTGRIGSERRNKQEDHPQSPQGPHAPQ